MVSPRMRPAVAAAGCLVLAWSRGCLVFPSTAWNDEGPLDGSWENQNDLDGDGYWGRDDCNEEDPTIFVGAEEVPYDGVDQDCNGQDLTDVDGDGHDSWVIGGDDCNDGDATVYAGAPELCDGIDNDCDGAAEPDTDADGDGHRWCEDCDEGDPTVFVGSFTAIQVPGDLPTIQEALAAAAPGDVVCVDVGTYVGPVVMPSTDPLELTAVSGGLVVIDGMGAGPALRVDTGVGRDVVVRGFTLTGGWAGRGGGVQIGGESSPTLEDLEVVGNYADAGGGGIWIGPQSAPLLMDLLVEDNESGQGGGGVEIEGIGILDAREIAPVLHRVELRGNVAQGVGGGCGLVWSEAEMTDVWIEDNQAARGGGLFVQVGKPALDGVAVTGNLATQDGGGVVLLGVQDVAITSSRIEGNSASEDGGGLVAVNTGLTLTATALVGNRAGDAGGGMALSQAELSADGLIVLGNEAVEGAGVGVRDGAQITLERAVIAGNAASGTGLGGGIRCQDSTVTLRGVAVSDNTAAGSGAGVSSDGCSWSVACSDLAGFTAEDYEGVGDVIGVDGNVSVDPAFLDTSSADPAAWDLHLGEGSPLIDAGDAAVLDPDGSPSDVGAYAGDRAGDWDLDRDGYPLWWQPGPYDGATYPDAGWDCDDSDPEKTPLDGC